MSISKRVVVSAVALGAIWIGTTAYISNNTKDYIEQYVQKTNSLYSQYGLKASLLSFEKGFFSSKAKIGMEFVDPTMKEELSKIFSQPMETEYSIENGPVFFKDGFGTGAIRTKSSINLNHYLVKAKEIKEFVKEDIVIDSTMTVGFDKEASFSASSNAITIEAPTDKIVMSPLKIDGTINMETFVGQFKMLIDTLDIEFKDKKGASHLKGIVFDGDITKFFNNGFYLGDFDFRVKQVDMQNDMLPFSLKNAQVGMNIKINENADKTINMDIAVDANVGDSNIPKEYDILKSVEFSYGLHGASLDGLLAFQDYTKEIQTKQQELLSKLQTTKDFEAQMAVMKEFQAFQMDMQKEMGRLAIGLIHEDKTSLYLGASVEDKKSKMSKLKTKIAYVGKEPLPTGLDELNAKFKKEFLNLIAFDGKITLQESLLDGLPKELKMMIMPQLQMAIQTKMLKLENGVYSFDASYIPRKLMVNGVDKSEMLLLLEMGLQQ